MKPPLATVKQFPPITKQQALEIAARAAMSHGGQFKSYSQKPGNSDDFSGIPFGGIPKFLRKLAD